MALAFHTWCWSVSTKCPLVFSLAVPMSNQFRKLPSILFVLSVPLPSFTSTLCLLTSFALFVSPLLSPFSLYLFLSVYLSCYLCICLSMRLFFCSFVSLSLWFSIYLYISLSISPYVYLSVSLSLCLYISLSLCLSVSLSLCLSISLSIFISVSLSLCLSMEYNFKISIPASPKYTEINIKKEKEGERKSEWLKSKDKNCHS